MNALFLELLSGKNVITERIFKNARIVENRRRNAHTKGFVAEGKNYCHAYIG